MNFINVHVGDKIAVNELGTRIHGYVTGFGRHGGSRTVTYQPGDVRPIAGTLGTKWCRPHDVLEVLSDEARPNETNSASVSISELEVEYCERAADLRVKQAGLEDCGEALHQFIDLRDSLQAHPAFAGHLPETYFSGGELDPVGPA